MSAYLGGDTGLRGAGVDWTEVSDERGTGLGHIQPMFGFRDDHAQYAAEWINDDGTVSVTLWVCPPMEQGIHCPCSQAGHITHRDPCPEDTF